MNISTSTPAEIDAEIARLQSERAPRAARVDTIFDTLHSAVGDEKVSSYRFGPSSWAMTDTEVLAKASAGEYDGVAYLASRGLAALTAYAVTLDAIRTLDAQIAPLENEYVARDRWTRAFLATSTNGHIHASTGCSTCRITTTFHWFTELSGHAESEIVSLAGADACTVCYPSAPVYDLKRPRSIFSTDEKAAQQARAEREAAKAERAATREAKALLPGGESLRFVDAYGSRESISTLHAAQKFLTDNAERKQLSWGRDDVDGVALVSEAVAAKTGETVAEVLAAAEKRASKRRR